MIHQSHFIKKNCEKEKLINYKMYQIGRGSYVLVNKLYSGFQMSG